MSGEASRKAVVDEFHRAIGDALTSGNSVAQSTERQHELHKRLRDSKEKIESAIGEGLQSAPVGAHACTAEAQGMNVGTVFYNEEPTEGNTIMQNIDLSNPGNKRAVALLITNALYAKRGQIERMEAERAQAEGRKADEEEQYKIAQADKAFRAYLSRVTGISPIPDELFVLAEVTDMFEVDKLDELSDPFQDYPAGGWCKRIVFGVRLEDGAEFFYDIDKRLCLGRKIGSDEFLWSLYDSTGRGYKDSEDSTLLRALAMTERPTYVPPRITDRYNKLYPKLNAASYPEGFWDKCIELRRAYEKLTLPNDFVNWCITTDGIAKELAAIQEEYKAKREATVGATPAPTVVGLAAVEAKLKNATSSAIAGNSHTYDIILLETLKVQQDIAESLRIIAGRPEKTSVSAAVDNS